MLIKKFFATETRLGTQFAGLASALMLALLLVACDPATSAVPPVATNTPIPTFTPTPEVAVTPVDAGAVATNQAVATVATQQAVEQQPTQPTQPTSEQQPTEEEPDDDGQQLQDDVETPTSTPVPPSPTPDQPSVVVDTNMNVRNGPGTNYRIVGAASQGDRFVVTGRNPAGDWWQINFQGQSAWLYGPLVSAENTGSVQVASNIPAPPPTNTPPPPTPVPPTPVPAEPTPTPEPVSNYQFNIAVVGSCEPNQGVTYVQGRTYINGQPQSGYDVAFSYAPDGPIVAKVQSGPHEGYPNWDAGFYSHILQADGPREGDWYFWIVDDSNNRISEMAHVHTDGTAGGGTCQQAVVDFDSR